MKSLLKRHKISKTIVTESGELVYIESFTDKLVNKLCNPEMIRNICLYYVWAIILYPCCKVLFNYYFFPKVPFPLKVVVYLTILIKVHEFSMFIYSKAYPSTNKNENYE